VGSGRCRGLSVVIWIVSIFLLWYARDQAKKGVLV
jgi:hypothetical protein